METLRAAPISKLGVKRLTDSTSCWSLSCNLNFFFWHAEKLNIVPITSSFAAFASQNSSTLFKSVIALKFALFHVKNCNFQVESRLLDHFNCPLYHVYFHQYIPRIHLAPQALGNYLLQQMLFLLGF